MAHRALRGQAELIGSSPFSEAQWKSVILEADKAGIDVHIHACGERAAHVALDAIEAAIAANGPRDRRHAIAHNVLTDDVDIPRFGKLGVIAQFSANWLSADPDTVDTLTRLYGPARQSRSIGRSRFSRARRFGDVRIRLARGRLRLDLQAARTRSRSP